MGMRTNLTTVTINDPLKDVYLIECRGEAAIITLEIDPVLFDGQQICIVIKQDSTGSATIEYGASISFSEGAGPTLYVKPDSFRIIRGVVNAGVLHIDWDSGVGRQTVGVWSANKIQPRTSNGCAPLAWSESSTNKVMTPILAFDASTNEYAQFSFKAPTSLVEVSFSAQLLWKEAPGSTSDDVVWGIQMLALSDHDVIDSTWGTTVYMTDTGVAGALLHTDEILDIVPDGSWQPGDEIIVQVFRNATSGSDTLDVDAHLIEVVIYAHYNTFIELPSPTVTGGE